MQTQIQWLGAGALDAASHTIVYSMPTQKILFGCAEGTQRTCTEHGIRIFGTTDEHHSRLSSIWLHSLRWSVLGGLAGLLSTLADAGSVGVKLFGPVGLKAVLASMRPFLVRPGFRVTVHELVTQEAIQDGNVIVRPVLRHAPIIKDTQLNDQIIQERMFPSIEFLSSAQKLWQELRQNASSNDANVDPCCTPKEPETAHDEYEVQACTHEYIIGWLIYGPRKLGKFDVDRAKQLGIPPGPLYGRLQKGESVVVESSGHVVEPSQVVSPPSPSPVVLMLFEGVQSVGELLGGMLGENDRLAAIITGEEHGPIEGVPSLFGHLVLPRECSETVLVGSLMQSIELNTRDQRYTIPMASRQPKPDGSLITPLMKLNLEPPTGIERCLLIEDLPTVGATGTPKNGPAVSFLGTAACMPGKYRNVSGVHANLAGGVLFDCGEGTAGQAMRMGIPFDQFRVICITHLHADHHCGVLSLLSGCRWLVAPSRFHHWIEEYCHASGQRFNYEPIDADSIKEVPLNVSITGEDSSVHIQAIPVDHCTDAYGFKLVFQRAASAAGSSGSIVYSGDTRPCQAIIEASRQATLLIHECTMPDDLLDEAIARKHSAFSEVISIVKEATPQFTVLTHYSQRLAKGIDEGWQVVIDEDPFLKGRVLQAADFLQIDLNKL